MLLLSVPPEDTVQVTPVFDESFVTVAVKFRDCPWSMLCVALGEIDTEMTGGLLPPPEQAEIRKVATVIMQPASSREKDALRMKNASKGHDCGHGKVIEQYRFHGSPVAQ